jgi:microcystin degradation protein MlrC
MTDAIVAAAPGCDAVLLDLHGAMVAEQSDDGEGDLLERVRAAVGPRAPIAVALDLHGNLTRKMVEHADAIVGYKTYPHIDIHETGAHAARLLFDALEGRTSRPTVRWKQLPLMAHTLRSSDLGGAMRRAIESARAEERAGVPAVSVFAGFSLADIAAPCVSVVATGEAQAAQAAADRVAAQIWREREDFVYRSEPLADSIARAKRLAEGAARPVLLLDHGDNCMSGGTCDTMDVLEAALQSGLEGIGVGPICDPQAVAELVAAGVGATVTVALGNKLPMPKLRLAAKRPLPLTGTVRSIGDGEYVIAGPTYTGMRCRMGASVLFDTGAARIVVTERTQEPWDLGVFECVGLDPRRERYLLLKSRMYCRPVFGPIAAGLVECDSDGATSSNYALFPFARLRRPVYPLDPAAAP